MGLANNTLERVLTRRIVDESGCWIWTGTINHRTGYGKTAIAKKHWLVHRFVYTRLKGEIPHGYQVDHLCKKRACFNPEHLEAVTHIENIRRSDGPSAVNARKTHCIRGHEFSRANTRVEGARRRCRRCCAYRQMMRVRRLRAQNSN